MNEILTYSQNEALAATGFLSGIIASVGIYALIFYILIIIANWKIFTKAGEKGWKSLIPIYNLYVFCRIIGVSFWVYILIIPLILGALTSVPAVAEIASYASGVYSLFLHVFFSIKLGNAFRRGILFKLGLIFFPNIFQLILAFGLSKYHGSK